MTTPTTGRRDLIVNRWVPLTHVFAFQGIDLTGADYTLAVRAVPDATGDPLLTVSVGTGATGITFPGVFTETVDFGGDIGEISVPVSYVQMKIAAAAINALPFTSPRGGDFLLWWDLKITPASGDAYRALEGKFTVHAGVVGTS
jgi:hypothetical protein